MSSVLLENQMNLMVNLEKDLAVDGQSNVSQITLQASRA